MLRNGRSKGDWGLRYLGCSCHNSKRERRAVKHANRQREKRAWKADAQAAY